MPPEISLTVCTSGRPGRLRALLDSACALAAPGLAWELLVVDNGGGNEAAEVAASFAGRLPLRMVREPVAGLSLARNRGVAEARGRYLCWVDDDVLLEPDLLRAYAAAFARHPEAALFGGRILPRLEPPAPAWFARNVGDWPLANLVARRDMGDRESPIALEGGRIPWGANFAVRAEEQRRHLYDPELGFSPRHKRTGEETDLVYRILKAGGSGWWVPDAVVRHVIPAERQTLAYLADYFDRAGRTAGFLHARAPLDNANAVYGTPFFARLGGSMLGLAAAAAGLTARAASLAGLERASLRFLARQAFLGGVAAHRRESRPGVRARSAPGLAAAGERG